MTTTDNQPPYEEATAFLKLLANPNRLAVLCKLHERPHNVTELAESSGLPQAAMSSQLALLREAGLVSFEVNHRERQYYIASQRDDKAAVFFFLCRKGLKCGCTALDKLIRKINLKGRLKIFQTTFLSCLVIYPLQYCLMNLRPLQNSPNAPNSHQDI